MQRSKANDVFSDTRLNCHGEPVESMTRHPFDRFDELTAGLLRVILARQLISILVILAFLTFFSLAQPIQATCKCVASGSATFTKSNGTWQTYTDGGATCDSAGPFREGGTCNPLAESYINLWFCVPTLGDLIGNLIRIIFFIAGLYAIFMLLLGGFEWVSSGGDEKKLTTARGKILSAVVGLVVMVAVMTLVVLVEQVIFGGKLCLGISCPLNMGQLAIIENTSPGGRASCFGPASRSSTLTPTGGATSGARLQLAPIGTGSAFLTPIRKGPPMIITATPNFLQGQKKPIVPFIAPSGTRVIILPYGGDLSPTKKIVLPGSGGGGGTGVPRPTIPPLE
jgi:hypothetical protein